MLSTIIPIYNTGRYLDKCISSVACQTYKDLEIILVNDCSSDQKTIDVIQKWVKKDSRILLIDKKQNEGVDKARVDGIYACHGEYLAFVDSDDWLPVDAFGLMMQKIVNTDADMVKGNMANVWLGSLLKKVSKLDSSIVEREILHEELMEKYFVSYFGVNIISVSLCGTIFRKSLFIDADIKPSSFRFGEDLTMSMRIFPFVRKFYQMEKVVYYYRQGMPGCSPKYLAGWLENANRLFEQKWKMLEQYPNAKCEYFQLIEMVNYLKTYVHLSLLYNYNDSENVSRLTAAIMHPQYQKLSAMRGTSYKEQSLIGYICDGNGIALWNELSARFYNVGIKTKIKNSVLRMVAKI